MCDHKKNRIVTLLVVLTLSMVSLIPRGLDLMVCFGMDGHVDVSLNVCQGGEFTLEKASPLVHGLSHHGDCCDVMVGCGAIQKMARLETDSSAVNHRCKSEEFHSAPNHSLPSEICQPSAGLSPETSDLAFSSRFVSASFPRFLHTVVLLI